MIYVEWLRVRNALRWTAIVLIAIAVVMLVLRFTYLTPASSGAVALVAKIESDPRSRVVVTTLPDGAKRTTVDSPDGPVHIVIDDRGYQGKHIEITQPSGGALTGRHISMPWYKLASRTTGGRTTAVIVTAPPQNFALYAGFAAFVALIVATVLGAPFARENDGHLEIALTKPIARQALVLATLGIDLAGIFAAWIAGILFLVAVHTMFYSFPHIVVDGQSAIVVALSVLTVAAWYCLLSSATASIKTGYGVVLGLAWPVALGVEGGTRFNFGASQIGQLVHAIIMPLAWINPLWSWNYSPAVTLNGGTSVASGDPTLELARLAALALAYGALAIVQWRRVEA